MLRKIETPRAINKPDTYVVYDYDATRALSTAARLVMARDPWLRIPPKESLIALPQTGILMRDRLDALAQLVRDPRFWPKGAMWQQYFALSLDKTWNNGQNDSQDQKAIIEAVERRAIQSLEGPLTQWATVFSGLAAMSGEVVTLRRPTPISELGDGHPLTEGLASIADMNRGDWYDKPGTVNDADSNEFWYAKTIDVTFSRVFLMLAYDKIVGNKFLSAVRDSEEGSAIKATISLIERSARFATLIGAMAYQAKLARLKPWLRFFLADDCQTELRRYTDSSKLDMVTTRANTLLKQALLPWYSIAEGGGLPSTRPSVWAESSATYGLPYGSAPVSGWKDNEYYKPVPSKAEPAWKNYDTLFERVDKATKLAILEHADLALDGRYDTAMTVLGVQMGGPVYAPSLWNPESKPVHSDGLNISEPMSLWQTLFTRVLPVDTRLAQRELFIGEPKLVWFNFSDRAQQQTFSVEPEQPEYSPLYVSARLDPRAVQSFDTAYQGDADAEFVPHEPARFAAYYGFTLEELVAKVGEPNSHWSRLYTDENGTLTPALETPWFVSMRTRQIWRNVLIVESAVPETSIGVFRGKIQGAQRAVSYMMRDLERPAAPYSVDAMVGSAYDDVKKAW